VANEPIIRLAAFLGVFLAVALWESVSPRRRLVTSRGVRWFSNICITLIGTAIVRGFFPVLAAAVAGGQTSIGILNLVAMPLTLKIIIGVLALDLFIYGQHVLFHTVPVLWRLHMMHHADLSPFLS
jgi:sterol desaturase/sphingolipid hydroxylase (fatty acid hydroxylase superfamily)